MLWAAGEEAPKKVFSHGFVNFEGKIGKSREEELQTCDWNISRTDGAHHPKFERGSIPLITS